MPPAPRLRVDRDVRSAAAGRPSRAGVDAGSRPPRSSRPPTGSSPGSWEVLGVAAPDSARPGLVPRPRDRAPRARRPVRVRHRPPGRGGRPATSSRSGSCRATTTSRCSPRAWWLTGDDRYAEAVADQLRSWWRANPFLTGVHWTSGIEVGRPAARPGCGSGGCSTTGPKVGDLFEHDADALRQIRWHQEYLAAFRSRGSSANNHVDRRGRGPARRRLRASRGSPRADGGARRRRPARARARREHLRERAQPRAGQRLPPVRPRARRWWPPSRPTPPGTPLADATWQLLARMLDAAAALVDVAGRRAAAGRRRRGPGPGRSTTRSATPGRSSSAPARALLGACAWWPRAAPGGVEAALLGALGAPARPVDRVDRAARPSRFADAGLALLRTPPEDGPEIWCRCDGGPHGFLSIAAHAHADALSIEVRHDGVEILADPGTYCYHGEPAWRSLVPVDRGPQHPRGGRASTSRSRAARSCGSTQARTTTLDCRLEQGLGQSWTARHDGYRRLQTPRRAPRAVALDAPARALDGRRHPRDGRSASPSGSPGTSGRTSGVELDGARARLTWSARLVGTGGDAHAPAGAALDRPPRRGGAALWAGTRPGSGGGFPTTSLIGTGELGPEGRLESTLSFDDATD